MFKARATTGRAAPVATVKTKGARGVTPLASDRRLRKQFANRIKRAYVAGWIRASRFANLGLIDHDDLGQLLGTKKPVKGAGRFGGFAHDLEQTWIEHILDQGRLTRSRDACDADQTTERDFD